ncbi:peptidoglycan editing factor PgeF [Aestuariispira ectoiniformans]|uniref:peptidoglycan editing factor PgeF n=1 Tax=Aestuariispira ectoiniformans TaxID=2775080 RepID=UPI00223B6E50|nr:peptidoglycan editing factor PgeF [Aestuariispira ectoiniformans]
MSHGPAPLKDASLALEPSVEHGFFTRTGGVSEGLYRGLNCGPGSSDNPAHIQENRARVAGWFGREAQALSTLYQIHSADVVTVTDGWDRSDAPKADAMVTDRPGVILGILTADCGPLLFSDGEAGVIGAAHAGWKGAQGGVAENTLRAMEKLGARRDRIAVALGPCIAPESYEVGPEFHAAFVDRDSDNDRFFQPSARAEHHMFDLPGFIGKSVVACGVKSFAWLRRDTRAEEDAFFSYRRSTLNGEPDYGRQLSAIMLRT